MHRTLLLLPLLLSLPAPAQWTLQQSHTTASLRGIHALGNGVAWASGTAGTVLRTTDDGTTWQTCATPPDAANLDFRGIQAFDAETAIVMSSGPGDLSRLYKTTDSCQTWKLVFTNPDKDGFWNAIKFASRDQGVILGDPVKHVFTVLLTFDGGLTWEHQTLTATEDINGEGAFAASNSSLLLSYGVGDRSFCTGGPGGPRVISLAIGPSDTPNDAVERTSWSGGLHASRLPMKGPSFEGGGCFSLAQATKSYGTEVAVGGNYTVPKERQNTAWTTAMIESPGVDSFSDWHPAKTPPHGYRSAVAYSPEHKAWITVGPNGTDLSTDDGRNWHPLKPAPGDAPDADRDWNALSLPFVVGPKGRIGKLNPTGFGTH